MSHNAEKLKGGLEFFNIHSVVKHQKLKGENFLFWEKNLPMPKKTERGTLWDFSTSILSQNSKKSLRGILWGKFFSRKKSLAVPKQVERGTFWSRPVWFVTRENRKNLFAFWFSSLGQMSQFGTIKLCRTLRTILVSSCGLKKRVTIIVAFHFMKGRLKRQCFFATVLLFLKTFSIDQSVPSL